VLSADGRQKNNAINLFSAPQLTIKARFLSLRKYEFLNIYDLLILVRLKPILNQIARMSSRQFNSNLRLKRALPKLMQSIKMRGFYLDEQQNSAGMIIPSQGDSHGDAISENGIICADCFINNSRRDTEC
jgi:hypothetical protein